MNPTDAHLVAGFLLREFDRFIDYLDDCAIDTVEATMIVESIAAESGGRVPTNIQQLLARRPDTFLTIEEQYIKDVIRSARTVQEFLWSDMNTGSGLEEFRRMFRKRLAKIEAISMDNPHWRIELLKRLLQTAAICVNLMTKAVSGRLTHNGIHPTMPSNLPQFDRPIGEI